MKQHRLLFVMAIGVLTARTVSAQCQAGRGGTLVSEGNRFEVKIVLGNPGATFTSDLYLAMPSMPAINFGTNRDVGRVTQLGKIEAGKELIFKIAVRNTGDIFFSGPANRNADGVVHADVECLPNGVARFSFEDLRNGGDQSYNDLRFEVKPRGCGNNTATSITELITGFPNCGPAAKLSPVWGSFGRRSVLESDEGEKLELECVASSVNYFSMFYTGRDGRRLRVGICPFVAGCNEAFFIHSGDANNDNRPDCFLLTSWTSKDYGDNDNPNPFTGQTETTPVLDHARSVFDAVSGNLTKTDLKFEYAVPPPIACLTGRGGEGRLLGETRVDPPLGDETEAFFQAVADRLGALPGPHEPMSESPTTPADLNGDHVIDSADEAILNAALGACHGQAAYNPQVDYDLDGCITFADQQIFEGLRTVTTDTKPPTLTVSAAPASLWPPNHEMIEVTVSVQVNDDTDPGPVVRLLAVTCDDGCDPAGDVADAAVGTDDRAFQVRAERTGGGNGRTYTVTYSATDSAGNSTQAQTTVAVRHDSGSPH